MFIYLILYFVNLQDIVLNIYLIRWDNILLIFI